MLPITLRGEPVYLLPYLANWADERPSLTLEAGAAITRSLGGIEARESTAHTLRATSFKCSLFLRAAESAAFRASLLRLGSTRVLMPLWPLAHQLIDGRIIYTDGGGAILTAPGGAIYTTGGIIPAAPTPLLTGLWLTFGMRNADFGLPNEEEEEDGVHHVADGGMLYIVHEAPLLPDWTEPESRALQAAFHDPHAAIRVPLMLGVLKKLPDPVARTPRLLSVDIDFEDTAPPFFAPRSTDETPDELDGAGRAILPLAPNWAGEVRAGGVSYEIEREQIGRGRTPATTYYPQHHARVLRARFATFSHAGLARLVAFFHRRRGPVETFAVGHPLDGLIAARFAKKTLDLSFTNGRLATLTLDLLEVPHETAAPPAGETPGATMGALPPRAQLFRFTHGLGSRKVVYRCTGYERDLVVDGELYLAQKIEHGDITESLEPGRTKVKLTARAWEGNPLMLLNPPRIEGKIQVEIFRCAPAADGTAAAPQPRFIGRIGKPDFDGPKITCDAAHLLADLQNNIPDLLIQAECNHEFCSAPCGVLLSVWTFTGAVAAADGATLALAGITRAGGAALPAIGAGWFARGRAEFGDGAGFQSRLIDTSTAPADGALTFYPACDGSPDRCRQFSNYQRFGGFPFVPTGNPALKPIEKNTSQGKK
jgi:hypothetical protein